MKFPLSAVALTLLLAACGRSEQAQNPPPAKLFEPQRAVLDKAKGVEQTVSQQADQQKQEADRQAE